MSHIIMALDCEYNQPSGKTIQIGAAAFDCRSGACHGQLDLYVNPGEPINPQITQLTGITDRDVQNAPDIVEAWELLGEFHKKHRCFKNPIVWGSGVRNDSQHLYEEQLAAQDGAYAVMEDGTYDAPGNFMGWRVLDVKTLYQSLMLFENGSYAGGLSDCMKRCGLVFDGEKHRAIIDARNAFRFWYYLTRLAHDGLKFKK